MDYVASRCHEDERSAHSTKTKYDANSILVRLIEGGAVSRAESTSKSSNLSALIGCASFDTLSLLIANSKTGSDGAAFEKAASLSGAASLETVKFLIDKHIVGNRENALSIAAAKGNLDVVERLISAGVDPNHHTLSGDSPLRRAAIASLQSQAGTGIDSFGEHLACIQFTSATGGT